MYGNLEDIKKIVREKFDNEMVLKEHNIQPTGTFIHDTASYMRCLLNDGVCKNIEGAWDFVIRMTSDKYWEHIAEKQRNGTERRNTYYDVYEDVDILKEVDELFNKGLL